VSESSADMVGEVIAQYRIVERLGGGAMGVVYKAEDTRLRRSVVLKFLPAELTSDTDANRRFMREARAASALDHPNICTVHEIGESPEGELFIVMPFYEGRTLKAVLAGGPLEPARAVDYARQIAAGLAHAGSHGVVHRDIKPANLMVADDGRVKIVDFGLALLSDGRRLTRSGAAVGTAAYMAPEQIQGADVGPAVDIWALGVVLHEMLTGDLPFGGETEPALLYAILHADPGSHTADRRPAPDVCRAIVDRCLLKDPGRRYDTARHRGSLSAQGSWSSLRYRCRLAKRPGSGLEHSDAAAGPAPDPAADPFGRPAPVGRPIAAGAGAGDHDVRARLA